MYMCTYIQICIPLHTTFIEKTARNGEFSRKKRSHLFQIVPSLPFVLPTQSLAFVYIARVILLLTKVCIYVGIEYIRYIV